MRPVTVGDHPVLTQVLLAATAVPVALIAFGLVTFCWLANSITRGGFCRRAERWAA